MLEPEDGISPAKAGLLLTIVAILGIGLYALSVLLETRSPDPLVDPDNLNSHTNSRLMETPDLWTGNKRPMEEMPFTPAPARPVKSATTGPVAP